MTQFQVGRTYWTRSAHDHGCGFFFDIIARTAKTVIVNNGDRVTKHGISVYNGVEQFKPFGSYSMAPIISADKQV
jgi:hypothetical protein